MERIVSRFAPSALIFLLIGIAVNNPALAQTNRIVVPIDRTRIVAVRGNVPASSRLKNDLGAADAGLVLRHVSLNFKPLPAQQAELDRFLADLQDPLSPNYHAWITPEQFGDRFSLSPNDLARVVDWLTSEGFSVTSTAAARNWVSFDGTVGQIQQSFHTAINQYSVNGELHFANATEPSVPQAIRPMVSSIMGLDDFRLQSSIRRASVVRKESPEYTSGSNHYLSPNDYATIYDINPLYNAGFDGSGQTLVVLGQTDINLNDITQFRSAYGLPPIKFQQLLVPGTTDPGFPVDSNGNRQDELQADFDIEWSSAIARNANVVYIRSPDLFTSAQYALSPASGAPAPYPGSVVTMSYGGCEQKNQSRLGDLEAWAQAGNASGITWIAASGDSGAAGCDQPGIDPIATGGFAVQVPAAVPEVTAVGGTCFNDGGMPFPCSLCVPYPAHSACPSQSNGTTYWSNSNSPTFSSALMYIPEFGWDEPSEDGLAPSGGGGLSSFYSKPPWQSVPGVTASAFRAVPDVAMAAGYSDSYLIVTETASPACVPPTCFNPLVGGYPVYGGTATAAASFAGIIAILNQYTVGKGFQPKSGMGNINPTLYRLSQTYPTAFNDITMGTNSVICAPLSTDCGPALFLQYGFPYSSFGYSAGPGYDMVTGLGSVNANTLITQWNGKIVNSTTSLTANPTSFVSSASTVLTAAVAGVGTATVPIGSISFQLPGKALGTAPLSGGTATLTVSGSVFAMGSNTVTAIYSGDSNFGGSSGSVAITVNVPSQSSAVVPTANPNPVIEQAPDAKGNTWFFTVTLNETAGFATTLTSLSIGGVDMSAQIVPLFGTPGIAAHGAITAHLVTKGYTPPGVLSVVFGGADNSGQKWSQDLPVTLLGPQGYAAMSLTGVPSAGRQNPAASASCQWFQALGLQESNGIGVTLNRFLANGQDLSLQIAAAFGSTRLPALGSLVGSHCWSGVSAPETLSYELDGVDDTGVTVKATASATFEGPPASASTLSLSNQSASLAVADSSLTASTSIAVTVPAGVAWAVSVFPANRTTTWLTVFPTAGTGPGNVTLQASGTGVSNGVHGATIIFQSPDSLPSFINVPVTFTIGASNGGFSDLGGVFTGKAAIGGNANGTLEAFVRGGDNALWDIGQPFASTAFGAWGFLGGGLISSPAVAANADGRLAAFVRGGDNAVWYIAQTSPGGSFGGWNDLGAGIVGDPAVALNSNGTLEVFVTGADNAVWNIVQTSPGGAWSNWGRLGGGLLGSPVVSRNADGRLEVFVRGTDGALWHIWQTSPGGAWSAWDTFGGGIVTDPAIAINTDGTLEAFAVGTNLQLWHIRQTTAGSTAWGAWTSFGGVVTAQPAVAANFDGRLEAFVRGGDNALWHVWQLSPGGPWSDWFSLGGGLGGPPSAAINSDGRLSAFVPGTDQALWMISQTSPGVWNNASALPLFRESVIELSTGRK